MLLAGGKRESLVHCLSILYICFRSSQSNENGVCGEREDAQTSHSCLLAQKGHSDQAVDWAYSSLPNFRQQAG